MKLSSLFVAASLLSSATAGYAATFSVNFNGDSFDVLPGDGICADAVGHCSLRAAVQEANALVGNDTIVLPAGTFTLSLAGIGEDLSASGDLDVTDDISILGAGTELTIIDGGAIDRVLDLRPAAVSRSIAINDLTLTNGFMTAGGSTTRGAGLRIGTGVTANLTKVTIRGNHVAAFGGAAGVDNFGCLQGVNVRIIGNTDPAAVGSMQSMAGGIVTSGATSCLSLDDSEISDNRGDFAGAIYVDGSAPVTLRRTLIANNTARFSGALELSHGNNVVLENVTISGNAGNPGAILNDGGTHLTLVNSTVADNHASGSSATVGGIHDVHGGTGLVFLSNTILAGNGPGSLADDCRNANSLAGGNIIGHTAGCTFTPQVSDQTNIDPGLGSLTDNGGFTRTRLPGPNAIDHGVVSGCAGVDQRGVARPQDGDGDGTAVCDVGAIELDIDQIFDDGFETGTRSEGSSVVEMFGIPSTPAPTATKEPL
ncbi:MAG: right-handed parallel beta-helix repeat-containing protein [Dokdonella sp.]